MDLSNLLEMASQSDPGRVRTVNEDSIACDVQYGFAVLADGMGGYNAGEVASGIAVSMISSGIKTALDRFDPQKINAKTGETVGVSILRAQIEAANAAIFKAAQSRTEYSGMGTTLVAALFYGKKVSVAHLGDSRMYRLRNGKLDLLTRDHSLLQEQLDRGMITVEEARVSEHKNLVTRALGIDETVETEVNSFDTQAADIYLLCSDGLNDMVPDEDIALTLQTLEANPRVAANQLVELANDNGGRDNVSTIVIKVKQESARKMDIVSKLLSTFRK